MTSTKSIAESTYAELLERKKKHQFALRLIEQEIDKRKSSKDKVSAATATSAAKKKSEDSKPKEKKEKKEKEEKPKKAKDSATKDEIKAVLNSNKVEFKSNMTKEDLMGLARKHSLVRAVEEKHKSSEKIVKEKKIKDKK